MWRVLDPPDGCRRILALYSARIKQGKELAGQDRALGVVAFSTGHIPREQQSRLLDLIDREERSFAVFTEFADPCSRQTWLDLNSNAVMLEVERMRRAPVTASSALAADAAATLRWSDQASRRLGAIRGIELSIAEAMAALCAARIGEARAELRDHTSPLLKTEKIGPLPAASIGEFMDYPAAGCADASPPAARRRGHGAFHLERLEFLGHQRHHPGAGVRRRGRIHPGPTRRLGRTAHHARHQGGMRCAA